ncbi:CBK_G0011410.mRNA.1.CDS.1 [Saccharomyces cerevisiae]|nr:CBK_G0011410.mRNA.1.CDS.1 [Saccharomyces cerevisiae]CAI7214945.1 CBK_G0011410.mRNA.1.CDS.1 [Saccharomyces cerevisiae]
MDVRCKNGVCEVVLMVQMKQTAPPEWKIYSKALQRGLLKNSMLFFNKKRSSYRRITNCSQLKKGKMTLWPIKSYQVTGKGE